MNKNCMRKPSIVKDGFFTLQRKTRSGIPNVTGIIYTKDAFEDAMLRYVEKDGGLYLAPVSIDDLSIYGERATCHINTEVYRNFHYPVVQKDYLIGKVAKWDDYTITFEYTPTNTSSNLLYLLDNNSKVALRYSPLPPKLTEDKIVREMIIDLLDVGVMTFDKLGINIEDIIKNM